MVFTNTIATTSTVTSSHTTLGSVTSIGPQRSTIPFPQLSLGVVPLWYRDAFHPRAQVIHGRMNSSMYREILEKNLQKSATSLGHSQNFVLQHNNHLKHTAKLTKEWFENNGISTLNWPSQSPDLNPIENLWNTLKVKVHERNPQNIKQLEELYKEEWGKVTLDQCGKLVANYKKRLEAVKKNKPEATQQNIKLMYPILMHRVILNLDKKKWIQQWVFNFPSIYN